MKKTLAVTLLLLLVPALVSAAQEETLKRKIKHWAAGQEWSLYSGYSLLSFEDEVWEDMLDKPNLPMMRFGGGWYALPNLSLDFAVGGLYEKAEAIGSISGRPSGEEYELYAFPVELSLRYRFLFVENQIIVPSVFVGFDWWYFKVDPEFGDMVEGDKAGFRYGADLGFLLDPLDPGAAHKMEVNYNVTATYLCLGYEVLAMDSEGGLDFSGDLITVSLRFDLGPDRAHAKP